MKTSSQGVVKGVRWGIGVVILTEMLLGQSAFAQPTPPGGGTGCTNCPPVINTNRVAVKFMNQVFSLLDTNSLAEVDTNLLNAVQAFPEDTNTVPNLQVAMYGDDA